LQRVVNLLQSSNNNNVPVTGMCQAIQSTTIPISSSVECLHHLATESISFDAVRILPPMGPMIDSTEAIVLVVGEEYNHKSNNKGWYERSDLNASIMHLIKKLGESPWLTKIVYIVSPSITNIASVSDNANETNDASSIKDDRESYLVSVVDAFITSYLGGDTSSTTKTINNVRPLPPDYTSSMIRSVLVLNDIDITSLSNMKKGGTEVNILPQGVGGSLPNLDLVFATYMSFGSHPAKTNGKRIDTSKSIYYGNDSVFRTHSFGNELEERVSQVVKRLGDMIGLKSLAAEEYANDLAGLLGFIGGLVIGPRQPHSSALNHGIDSLTIEVRIPNNGVGASSNIHPHYADLTRCMEHLLRSISNLHERLHHSIAQYIMPSPSKFVSHGEYIFPAILVSLPMVVRAAKLALRDLKRFHFMHVVMVACAVCTSTLVISVWGYMSGWKVEGHTSQWIAMYFISYLVVVYVACLGNTQKEEKTDRRGSLRFISCLCGIYLHVPLLLANYSLGFPSSAFWTPLLAILILPDRFRSESKVILSLSLIVVVVVDDDDRVD